MASNECVLAVIKTRAQGKYIIVRQNTSTIECIYRKCIFNANIDNSMGDNPNSFMKQKRSGRMCKARTTRS